MSVRVIKHKKNTYSFGFQKGRRLGFQRGKQAGYEQGLNDAKKPIQTEPAISLLDQPVRNKEISLIYNPSDRVEITEQLIRSKWTELNLSEQLLRSFNQPVFLTDTRMHCLKDTFKSSIWKIEVQVGNELRFIILKVIKSLEQIREESIIELNMYLRGEEVLHEVMPQIYCSESIHGDAWFFMEFVKPLEGQIDFTPRYFDKIIPSLAILHARTFNERFYVREDLFMPWIPMFNSKPIYQERTEMMHSLIHLLKKAMKKSSSLKKLIEPSYPMLEKVLLQGPNYFPELIDAGQSIVHSDLQMGNIGCNQLTEDTPWEINFIDWEGARFTPCWTDLANLVGVFLSYRDDWRSEEDKIISHCAYLYNSEMNKHEIEFKEDPVRLYKMADIQRILEKSLYQQIHWAMDKTYRAELLPGSIEKIKVWGKELGMY